MLGGVLSIGAISAIGVLLPTAIRIGLATGTVVFALAWHARGARTFIGSRSGRQASRRVAQQARFGRVYFGAVLGFGVLTYMTTPLVYAGWLYGAEVGLPLSLLIGAGFGLGRSRPLATGLVARGGLTPVGAAELFADLRAHHRLIGCALAGVTLAALALRHV